MEIRFGTELRDEFLSFELALGARKLIEEVMLVRAGETVVITGDTSTDRRVVEATARAAYAAGACPAVVWYQSRPEPVMEPPSPVRGAICNADVWIEFAAAYLLYSKAHKAALETGVRYIALGGVDTGTLVRTLAAVDFQKILQFSERFCEVIRSGNTLRMVSANGSVVTGEMRGRPVRVNGQQAKNRGETTFLCGQITCNPVESTINGVLSVDGTIYPPAGIGRIFEPVLLRVEQGVITQIEGGCQARVFETWLRSLNDPNMFRIAHFSAGHNPGVAQLTGHLMQDERFFGCMVIGMGSQGKHTAGGGWDAASHTDAIILRPSLWIDNTQIQDDGRFVHPELRRLCREMGVAGY